MRFKLDENMPHEIGALLRAGGHDAVTVLDENLGGAADSVLASAARDEERVLATLDRDFADIRRYPPVDHRGLLVFRVVRQDPDHLIPVWTRVLEVLADDSIDKELWIVEEHGIRRRQG